MNRSVMPLIIVMTVWVCFAPQVKANYIFEGAASIDYVLNHHVIVTHIAKDVCSCMNISKFSKDECLRRTGLPTFFAKLPILRIRDKEDSVVVEATSWVLTRRDLRGLYSARAVFNKKQPQFGCHLEF